MNDSRALTFVNVIIEVSSRVSHELTLYRIERTCTCIATGAWSYKLNAWLPRRYIRTQYKLTKKTRNTCGHK